MSFEEEDRAFMAGTVYGADPDAVVSLAAFISRDWGYGTRLLGVRGLVDGGAIGECRSSDGSYWFVGVDRWGTDLVSGDHAADVCAELYRRSVERFNRSERGVMS